jgi:hypothetical protein
MTVDALPHGSVIVIDTSVLIALGRPENEKFQRFEQFVTATDSTVHIPEYVAAELGESPDTYRYQREHSPLLAPPAGRSPCLSRLTTQRYRLSWTGHESGWPPCRQTMSQRTR